MRSLSRNRPRHNRRTHTASRYPTAIASVFAIQSGCSGFPALAQDRDGPPCTEDAMMSEDSVH